MKLACVRKLYARVHANPDHKYHGIELYIISGRDRPVHNLLRAEELGYLGKCSINPVLSDTGAPLQTLSFDEIVSSGQRVKLPETTEEHRLRIERETGNIIHGPGGIAWVTTIRVFDTTHRPDSTTQRLTTQFSPASADVVAGA